VPDFDFLDLGERLPNFFPPGMVNINLDFIVPDIPGSVNLDQQTTSGPTAFFEIEKEDFDGVDAKVRFINRTVQGDSFIAFYSWSFGNGNRATTTNPEQVYTSSGVFTVTLIASDNEGRSSTYTMDVVIEMEPPSKVLLSKTISYEKPGIVSLNASNTADIQGSYFISYFRNEGNDLGPYFTLETSVSPSEGSQIKTGLSGSSYTTWLSEQPEFERKYYKAGSDKSFIWGFE